MTNEQFQQVKDAFIALQELPRKHAQEIWEALYAWNKAKENCDHKYPDNRNAIQESICSICMKDFNE